MQGIITNTEGNDDEEHKYLIKRVMTIGFERHQNQEVLDNVKRSLTLKNQEDQVLVQQLDQMLLSNSTPKNFQLSQDSSQKNYASVNFFSCKGQNEENQGSDFKGLQGKKSKKKVQIIEEDKDESKFTQLDVNPHQWGLEIDDEDLYKSIIMEPADYFSKNKQSPSRQKNFFDFDSFYQDFEYNKENNNLRNKQFIQAQKFEEPSKQQQQEESFLSCQEY